MVWPLPDDQLRDALHRNMPRSSLKGFLSPDLSSLHASPRAAASSAPERRAAPLRASPRLNGSPGRRFTMTSMAISPLVSPLASPLASPRSRAGFVTTGAPAGGPSICIAPRGVSSPLGFAVRVLLVTACPQSAATLKWYCDMLGRQRCKNRTLTRPSVQPARPFSHMSLMGAFIGSLRLGLRLAAHMGPRPAHPLSAPLDFSAYPSIGALQSCSTPCHLGRLQ